MIYLKLGFIFFKIGFFTIGGGYAMIPLIQQELINQGFLQMEEITNIIAISEMTPGPFSINAATFVGMKLYGLPGAFACTLGLIAPSLIIMTVVALFFFQINKKPGMQALLYGIRPVVWSLIMYSTISVARSALITPSSRFYLDFPCLFLFLAVFGCLWFIKKVSPIVFILLAGILGAVFLR